MIKDIVLAMLNNERNYKQNLVDTIRMAGLKGLAMPKGGALERLQDEVTGLDEIIKEVKKAPNDVLRAYLKEFI